MYKIASHMELLNPEQIEAVHHMEGPLLVLAGAGSGKTRVITHRIAHLIEQGIAPEAILAVTFTNRAADEMRRRIFAMKHLHILASTFHSLGAKILRASISPLGYTSDFSIYDEDDSLKIIKSCLEEKGFGTDKASCKEMKRAISNAKNDLLSPEQVAGDLPVLETYLLYQTKMQHCNALDFDDLLYCSVKLFETHPEVLVLYQQRWKFLLIDEYQDTNLAQYRLTKLLLGPNQNLFAVGDPDQSIYSWRGARYENILNFEKDFPGAKKITLDQNYRSTNTILQAANALIAHNEARFEKELWSKLGEGSPIGLFIAGSEKEETAFVSRTIRKQKSQGIALDEIAILYRTNAQSRPFEDRLLMDQIPYQIIGGLSFYERKEIKDLLAFLTMLLSNSDLIAFSRTLQLPKRGVGPAAIQKIAQAASNADLPIFSFALQWVENPGRFPLSLGAKARKGLEEYVHLIESLRRKRSSLSMKQLIEETIAATQYAKVLQEDPETAQDRKENLDELLSKAAEWEEEHPEGSVIQFLEEISLRSHVEKDPTIPSVKLMSLHNGKGLEFHTVFLVGMEEDLFPHIHSKEEEAKLEEERRLCYVGITRARRSLYLTTSLYRYMWGQTQMMRPSRFLKEIPKELMYTIYQK